MKKKAFLLNTLAVTFCAILIRIIAIAFRVYMSSSIGAEALGLYQLVLTIYTFAISFISSGISLAVTRVVTDYLAIDEQGKARKTIKMAFVFAVGVNILIMMIMFCSADFIGSEILKDQRADMPLKILSFSLPFVAMSSVCRGYFLAVRKAMKSITEQILEQITEIVVFAVLIGKMLPKGVEYACSAVVIGTVAGEVVSFLYSYILYKTDRSISRNKKSSDNRFKLLSKLLKIAMPIAGSSCLRSGLSAVENIMIPKGLKKQGSSYEKSLSDYGKITGMVMPVITFPSAFLLSFSILLIPEISEANAVGRKNNIRHITSKAFIITFLFAIPVTGILFFFGKDLCNIIYADSECGFYVSLLAPIIPFMYLDSVVDGILKGLNDQVRYLTYNLIESVTRIALIFILLPILGIKGLIIVIFTGEVLNSSLSILRLIKLTELKFDLVNWVIKPVLAILFPGILLSNVGRFDLFGNELLSFITKVIVMIVSYIIILKILKAVKEEDRSWFRENIKKLVKSN